MFFVSDTHFGHKNIIQYSNRPFSCIREMHEVMIQRWNAIVKKDDLVFHLGDIAFGNQLHVLNELNGRVKYIPGNHARDVQVPQSWECVGYMAEIRSVNPMIVLNHYGQRVWNKHHHGAWHLYGHSHGSLPPHGLSVDVGVDSPWVTGTAEYRPFHLDEIRKFMATQKIVVVDHHESRDGSM